MPTVGPYVLQSEDPYRKSVWANYILELAKNSELYSYIADIDKSNTYDIPISPLPYEFDTVNCSVLIPSMTFPVIEATYSIVDDHVSAVVNGDDCICDIKDAVDGKVINILDVTVKLDITKPSGSVKIYSGSIYIDRPSAGDINQVIDYVPSDILNKADMEDPADSSSIYCIGLLKRHVR